MTKKESLKANVIFSFISQLVCYISPLIVSPYLSRVLGPEGIGAYSYAYSYVYYFSSVVLFGFSSYGIKRISQSRDDKSKYSQYFWTIFCERFFFFSVFSSIYILLIFYGCFGKSVDSSLLYALILVLISNAFDISFLFQGLERFNLVSYAELVVNLAYIVSIFLLVKSSDDLLRYTIIKSSVGLLLDIFLWLFSIKKISIIRINKQLLLDSLFSSAGFFLPTILMTAGTQIDQTFIGMFCDTEQVGYYQQASKIPSLISSLIYAIAPVMLSRISFLYSNNKLEECKEKIGKAINLALYICIPCCVGMYLIGSYFIPAFFGEEYLPSINILYCLLPVVLFSPISSILISSFFYPCQKTKEATVFLGASLILNSLLTFTLTKFTNLGGIGAAIGTLVSEVFLFSLVVLYSRKMLNARFILTDLWKILISSLAMTIVILLINIGISSLSNLLISIIDVLVGIFVFFLFSFLLKERNFLSIISFLKQKIKSRSSANHKA